MNRLTNNIHNLSNTDMARSTLLCQRVHRIHARESFVNHAFAVLSNAVKCTHFCFTHFKTDPLELVDARCETIAPEVFISFKAHMSEHLLLQQLIQSRKSQVRTLQSSIPTPELHKTRLYTEIFAPLEIEDQLFLSLRYKTDLFIISYDRDKAFTQNEQTQLRLLQPHVNLAWENWHHMRKLEQQIHLLQENSVVSETAAEQTRTARQWMNLLTPRQKNIAELVTQGLENRAIAETLHIASKTVGKHLENIFGTLKIHHRAALAAEWQRAKSHLR